MTNQTEKPATLPTAPKPAEVRVKGLEWRPHHSRPGIIVADLFPGEYWAWELAGYGYWSWGSLTGREVPGGIEAAKAAVQADHERRSLSALDPSSSGCGAGAEAKIKETLMASREFWDGLQQIRNGNWSESHFAGVIEHIILPTPPAREG